MAMLHHFFSTGIIVIFSVLSGIVIHVLFNDYGVVLALAFYGIMFFIDYTSTVKVSNYEKYETNPLFSVLSKRLGNRLSFGVILAVGIIANITLYLLLHDFVFCYILGMCHVLCSVNNHFISKKISIQYRESKS